tara:strand:- start:2721 stop:2954 length:234 start_codon:yes stop_codon:yes gene_type:complete
VNLIALEKPVILWTSVNSIEIKKLGYEREDKRLHIAFKRGDIPQEHCNVPEKIYRDFLTSQSKGTYYKQYIEGKYQC